MVTIYDTAAKVHEKYLVTKVADNCDKGLQLNDGPLALSFIVQNRIYLQKKGPKLLQSFRFSMEALARVRLALNQPEAFNSTTLEDLEGCMVPKFSVKDALKERSARCLANPSLTRPQRLSISRTGIEELQATHPLIDG